MKKLLLAFLMVFAISICDVKAQSKDYENAVGEYLSLTNTKKTVEITLVQTYNSMGLPVNNMEGMVNEMLDSIWSEYIKESAKVMGQYFSLDDLNEINAFYKTPVGVKFGKAAPEIANELSKIMMQSFFINKMESVIMKYIQ